MASTKIRFSLKAIGQERKFIAAVIGEAIGDSSRYTGVPACAYQIGGWALDKDSILYSPELKECEFHIARSVLSGLQALGLQSDGFITVTVPDVNEQTAENLGNIIKSKQTLFQSALNIDEKIVLKRSIGTVSLSCFRATLNSDTMLACLILMVKLYDLAKTLRYASPVERSVENQKYAFRCFLLRLGFIGKNYKNERKILLASLCGNTAFKSGVQKGTTDERNSIQRTAYISSAAVFARNPGEAHFNE